MITHGVRERERRQTGSWSLSEWIKVQKFGWLTGQAKPLASCTVVPLQAKTTPNKVDLSQTLVEGLGAHQAGKRSLPLPSRGRGVAAATSG